MAVRVLRLLSFLLDRSVPNAVARMLVLAATIFGICWTVLEAAGVAGSVRTVVLLAVSAIGLVFVVLSLTWALRWPLLYSAIKTYVRDELAGRVITADSILVTCGPGGTIILGMVVKAMQELGYPVPRALATDQAYREDHPPDVGRLLPADLQLTDHEVLIVLSYVGTGKTLNHLRSRLRISNAPLFSVVVSHAARDRETVDYYLIVGGREAIPWPKLVSPRSH